MLRPFHALPGLIATLLLVSLALSGAILSLNPALERAGTTVSAPGQINVAMLADRISQHIPGVEQIQRTPSGSVIVYYSQGGQTGATYADPSTGQATVPYAPSAFSRFLKNLHRSLLLGTSGRVVSGLAALIMLMLCLSGAALLAKRQGGWRQIMRPLRGSFSQRWHGEIGRIVVLGLLLSALTGVFMSAATFGLIPDGMQDEPDFPAVAGARPAAPVLALPALRATDLNDFRELVYPAPGAALGAYSLHTAQGDGYVDPMTGSFSSYQAHSNAHRLSELVYRLHTGEGLWWLGLLLGLCALSVPLMSVTGTAIWWRARRSMVRITGNSGPQSAETIILVGSETHSTWGFAKVLHDALRQAGQRVHTAPMNRMAADYPKIQRLLILTSTYGDGSAPQSATQFFARLDAVASTCSPDFAVLGFGDRQFPGFCQFSRHVQDALVARGWRPLMEMETIDRQSPQEFARWGQALGKRLGRELKLAYTPKLPRTHTLELIGRADYGEHVQVPTSILRFGPIAPTTRIARILHRIGLNRLPHFEAGDLVGVVPPGSTMPRFYSLASGSSDGALEICVRKHPQGLCSQMLHALQPGDRVNVFIRANPDFRPASGKSAIILIGAGTGIGPLAGFIRNNRNKFPMYLYWGGRDPASDFLYEPELAAYLADHRLTQLHTAFSRTAKGAYVQDRVTRDAAQMRRLVENGAQVLVCGSRAMAASIMQAINEILTPLGLSVQTLKRQGRYREDVF